MFLGASRVVSQGLCRRAAGFCSVTSPPPPLILILNLDETLLRRTPSTSWTPSMHKTQQLANVDFTTYVDVGGGASLECSVSLRPGLSAFFDWVRARRNAGLLEGPWLFGQGGSVYLKEVLQKVDPMGDLFAGRVLAQSACTPLQKPWPWALKDLTRVPCAEGSAVPDISRMVLVENNAVSAILNPGNALLVRDWLGDDAHDTELERVSAILDTLMSEGADSGGDYARHLTEITPGHVAFQQRLGTLRERLEADPPTHAPLKIVVHNMWKEACDIKQEVLR